MRTTLERTQDGAATEFAAIAMEAWAQAPPAHVPGRRARPLLRPADARQRAPAALRRAPLGARRRARDARRQLAGACGPARSTRRRRASRSGVTQRRRFRTEGAPRRRHLRRVARRHQLSRARRFRLPARGARPPPRGPDARHRRDDPVRPVPADHRRARGRTRRPGRARHRARRPSASTARRGCCTRTASSCARVLVVGPNPTFMDYVSHVLPALGEEAVEQRAVSELLDGIETGREDAQDVARLKADPRLAEVVRRAVELAVRPAPRGARALCRRRVRVGEGARGRGAARGGARAGARARAGAGAVPHGAAPALLRALRRAARPARAAELRRPRAGAAGATGSSTKYLDRVLAAPARGEARGAAAHLAGRARGGGGRACSTRDEQRLLLRDRPRRAPTCAGATHDLPLLDAARTLVEGPPSAYGHVIVDEAQDLSPMQLLMVSRRAVDGSLTMLGDVAQATGPVTYGRWEELEPYLPGRGRGADRGAAPRVPRSGRDHGARPAPARADRPRRRAADRLPAGRGAAAARAGGGGRADAGGAARGGALPSWTGCSP